MPSNWSMIDNNFPSFTGEERPREQIAQLQNYLMLLVEQLKYQLNNLSAMNWNDSALEELQADTTKDVEDELSNVAGDLNQTAADLASVISRLAQVETALTYLERSQEEHETRISELEDRADRVDADLDNHETRISELEDRVDGQDGDLDNHETRIGELEEDLGSLLTMVNPDGIGGAVIGGNGKEIRLIGKIYINGVLLEGGGT